MLLSFRVANHRSIRDELRLPLTPVYESERPQGTDWQAVPVVALFGANAAGKSNVVDALRFMARMVRSSHRDAEPDEGIPREPFLLDNESVDEPSWYVVDLLLEGIRYTYGFSIDDHRVLDEWLYSYPKGRKRTIFQRSADEVQYGDTMPKRELDLVWSITEPNALFVSVAARSMQSVVRPVYDWFRDALTFPIGDTRLLGRYVSPSLVRILEDPGQASAIIELLRAADVGIENIGVSRVLVDEDDELPHGSLRAERNIRRSLGRGDTSKSARIWFEQRGRAGKIRLGHEHQSEGTRALLAYAAPVLRMLASGGLLVVDEIDSSLHPRLTAHLIKLFQHPESNPHGAQLLLTTHDVSLLGRSDGEDILRRDQVWFAEKDENGETSIFPLSDFKPRQEENRERRYLGGSYGAVPFLNDERFEAAVAARGRVQRGEDTEE
ncbi:AAA family ATPase [Streptomyces sp. NBC_01262]|uniref:AAA family ATPase n=1 Tax=Streptomyces sp. NBC_01262 TaxID=2903803 RepID=UPI002E36281A|nr:ATP-binding protein [Streptomyces sp. NBC_01262]